MVLSFNGVFNYLFFFLLKFLKNLNSSKSSGIVHRTATNPIMKM